MAGKANYAASYRELGYELRFNQEWSAEKSDGVCISLWVSELQNMNSDVYDTEQHAKPLETWTKSMNTKRIPMLLKALHSHEGWVDAVIRDDTNGRTDAPTKPWMLSEQGGLKWKLIDVDKDTGHFKAVKKLYTS